MVLLSALVHLLVCAHGPTPNEMGRADAVLTATVTAGQAARPADDSPVLDQGGPAQDNDTHCSGMDEPTVQASRDTGLAVHVVHEALSAEHLGDRSALAPPALQPSPRKPGESSAGHARARLGVWRT
ncbi:hypothetical protein [Streptomyces albiflavescens]|uniref:hypothetical protein n=1 Tax=Streptomyces albiflavescens TaxID=1623582 RepID=UPI00166BAC16|nr:hypothetical protein [Streptomyces albiflavescens]